MSQIALHKPRTTLPILVAGVAASLFASGLTSNIEQQIQQPVSQLAVSTTTSQEATEQASQSALVLAAIITGSIVVGVALKQRDKSTNTTGAHTILTLNQANHKLQKKLLLLLHDDREAANRLLTQAMYKYPNKTVDWYFEKVIYDLERDRHG